MTIPAFQFNAFQHNAFQEAAAQSIVTVSTQVLNLPINCVLAGQQIEEVPRKFPVDMFGILKRIFRE